jgi:hypothetical protein
MLSEGLAIILINILDTIAPKELVWTRGKTENTTPHQDYVCSHSSSLSTERLSQALSELLPCSNPTLGPVVRNPTWSLTSKNL